MSHYKPYPAYKDSGVEWLGRVPEHWVTKKLLYWISGYGSGTTPSKEDEYSTDGLPWVTTGELRENTVASTEKRVTQEALKNNSALKVHPAGSLVIAMYGATVGRLGVLGVDATLNQACFAIHPSERVRVPFLRHWFEGFRSELIGLATGAGQPNISGDKIRNLLLPCPEDLSEQVAIITHLNHETARIDALMEKKTRFIELLREKRQALITYAVTKGLDPNVKMKDSGLEWLGEVPKHWSIKPFKVCIDFQEGPGIMAVDFRDEGIPLLRVAGVQGRWATLEGCNYLKPDKVERQWKHFRLVPGDLLISASASMGTVCEVADEAAGSIAYTGLIRLRGKKSVMLRSYIRSLVVSSLFSTQIDLFKAGSTIQHFGPIHLSQMFVVCPPLDEQEAIAQHVESETLRIDELIAKSERSVELLKERRSAMITAAVTGQIDLRETV